MSPTVREAEVTQAVRALTDLGVEALRAEWRARYGPPPPLRSADHLRRLLAWRIQAEAFGGLEPEIRRALLTKLAKTRGPILQPGVRLAREWQGVRYEVEIVEGGVRFKNQTFGTLSAVAREITGVRWNGPRFFGLRQEKRREAKG